jgi:hypothetical protein
VIRDYLREQLKDYRQQQRQECLEKLQLFLMVGKQHLHQQQAEHQLQKLEWKHPQMSNRAVRRKRQKHQQCQRHLQHQPHRPFNRSYYVTTKVWSCTEDQDSGLKRIRV